MTIPTGANKPYELKIEGETLETSTITKFGTIKIFKHSELKMILLEYQKVLDEANQNILLKKGELSRILELFPKAKEIIDGLTTGERNALFSYSALAKEVYEVEQGIETYKPSIKQLEEDSEEIIKHFNQNNDERRTTEEGTGQVTTDENLPA